MSLTPGTRLGVYDITAQIGEGGMGQVFRATDTKLKRQVAIKILPPAVAADPERLARFQREAEVLASLNHPNIAGIYGLEDSAGITALVMELVEGDDLSQRIARGAIPFDEALPIAKQIADALEAAHERGIIHRDLKPANVKVRADGTVKVLDFGLAKAMEPAAGSSPGMSMSPTRTTPAMTQAGVILGTAAYMSPEQARGKAIDKRADIWAFGALLFEMLTGKRAFHGEDMTDTIVSVVSREPDWAALPAATPAGLRRLLARCLKKDAKVRLQAIGEARVQIEDVMSGAPEALDSHGLPAYDSSLSTRPSALPWILASVFGAATIALAAVSIGHFRERPVERQVLQYSLALPDKVTRLQAVAVSPDGHYLVMQTAGEDGQQLWLRSLDSLQTQPLAGTTDGSYPFWSPDSRYIGFFTPTQLKKIPVIGGPAQALCDAPVGRGGTWSKDGVILFAPDNGNLGLSRVSAAGGVPVPVARIQGGGAYRWPQFLPDGQRFLYLATNGNENGIYMASLDTVDRRRLVLDNSNPEYVPPSSGNSLGHVLFVRQGTLMAQPVDPQTLDPKGDLFPVAERVTPGPNIGSTLYSVSENGILILQSAGDVTDRQLRWFDRAGKEAGTVGAMARSRNSVALSPDGKRVAVERIADNGSSDLWIIDMEHNATETRLTFGTPSNGNAAGAVADAVWSPDGSKVAFAANHGASSTIFQIASNGIGKEEVLLESDVRQAATDWSRDGRFLIFNKLDLATQDDIWALPVSGSGGSQSDKNAIRLVHTALTETQGQLSPDSRWIAYTSRESGNPQVYVEPFAPGWDTPMTGKWQISAGGGWQPRWRGDGKELFYTSADRRLMAVEVKTTAQTFNRGTPQALFPYPGAVAVDQSSYSYAPSADGQRFLVYVTPRAQGQAPPLTVVVNWMAGVKK